MREIHCATCRFLKRTWMRSEGDGICTMTDMPRNKRDRICDKFHNLHESLEK